MLPTSYYIVAAQRRLLRGILNDNRRSINETCDASRIEKSCFNDKSVTESTDKRPKHKFVKSLIFNDDAYCTECHICWSSLKSMKGCDPVYCLGSESPWLAYMKPSQRATAG